MNETSKLNLVDIDHPSSSAQSLIGVVVNVGGWQFRVRALNDRHREWLLFAQALRARNHKDKSDFTTELYRELPDFLAEHVVVGWTNARLKDGEIIEYSRDTARELFTIHSRLAMEVFEAANAVGRDEDDKAREDESAAGNVPDGASNGEAISPISSGSNAQGSASAH